VSGGTAKAISDFCPTLEIAKQFLKIDQNIRPLYCLPTAPENQASKVVSIYFVILTQKPHALFLNRCMQSD